MYCRKCGRQVADDQPLCEECRRQETGVSEIKPEEVNTNRMYGFTKALVGTILGVAAYIFSTVACLIVDSAYISAVSGGSVYYNFTSLVNTSWAMMIISIPMLIIAMVFGVKSIKMFNRIKQQGGVKPIPAFVLGIVAVVSSAVSILMVFCTFLMLVACSTY